MGEAKRRRDRIGKPAGTAVDPKSGKVFEARYAGRLLDFFAGLHFGKPSAVPCRGCVQCCYHHCINVDPNDESAENLAHLDLVPHPTSPDEFALRKREDGACVHLGPEGCTVYQYRPRACRYYDCRVFSALGIVDTFDDDRHSPAWLFDRATPQELIYELALQTAAAKHIEATPEWDSTSVLAASFMGVAETLPAAITTVAKKINLPPAEVRAMRVLFQDYLEHQPWYRKVPQGTKGAV